MTRNKQFANVGNLGDILKHAALVSLIELLHSRGQRLLSVDTHSFLLEALCPDPSKWLLEAQRDRSSHAAFESYITHQKRVGRWTTFAWLANRSSPKALASVSEGW